MIVYQQAFDLYYNVFRLIKLLTYFDKNNFIELERLRIWDYYLLFPNRMSNIRLRRDEKEARTVIKDFIVKEENLYEQVLNDRKMFEKMKPYQLSAIKSLASYGIINKDYLSINKITTVSKDIFTVYPEAFRELSIREDNAIRLLTSFFYQIPLNGEFGLKHRTNLIESKYDA